MQIGSPDRLTLLGVMPCYDQSETILHQDFRAFNIHGEWFKPSPELLDYIKKNTTPL
jgi:hypothetical protein